MRFSNTLRATNVIAIATTGFDHHRRGWHRLILSTKSVVKDIIAGASNVGGEFLSFVEYTARGAAKEPAEASEDVALVVRRAVNVVIEATRKIGGNTERLLKSL